MQREERPATQAQIEYATDLILRLGYDLDWYNLDKMNRGQISRLIDELKDDWEMDVKEIVKKYHNTCRRYQLSDEYLQEQKCTTRMEMPTAVEFRYGVVYLQDAAVDVLIKRIEELEGRHDGHKGTN